MTCDEVRDLAPAYVLGALDEVDTARVRDHLASCGEPHPELVELGSVVPALAASVDLVEPPGHLRSRIIAAAAADLAGRWSSGGIPDELTRDRRPPSGAVPRWSPGRRSVGWAIGIAAVIAVAALGAWNVALRSDLAAATAYRDVVDQVLAIAAQPGSHTAILSSPDDPARSGLAAIAADGSIHVVMRGLAPTTGSAVYEAWVIAGSGPPRPIGSFTVGSDGVGVLAAAGPGAGGVTVGLTLEPGPGATTPTLPLVSSGVASSS